MNKLSKIVFSLSLSLLSGITLANNTFFIKSYWPGSMIILNNTLSTKTMQLRIVGSDYPRFLAHGSNSVPTAPASQIYIDCAWLGGCSIKLYSGTPDSKQIASFSLYENGQYQPFSLTYNPKYDVSILTYAAGKHKGAIESIDVRSFLR